MPRHSECDRLDKNLLAQIGRKAALGKDIDLKPQPGALLPSNTSWLRRQNSGNPREVQARLLSDVAGR